VQALNMPSEMHVLVQIDCCWKSKAFWDENQYGRASSSRRLEGHISSFFRVNKQEPTKRRQIHDQRNSAISQKNRIFKSDAEWPSKLGMAIVCLIFVKTEMCRQFLIEFPKSKFKKFRSAIMESLRNLQTDGRTDGWGSVIWKGDQHRCEFVSKVDRIWDMTDWGGSIFKILVPSTFSL